MSVTRAGKYDSIRWSICVGEKGWCDWCVGGVEWAVLRGEIMQIVKGGASGSGVGMVDRR